MDHHSESLSLGRIAARLEEANFGVAEPLLGSSGPPIPSALEIRDLIEDLREMLFPGLTDGRSRSSLGAEAVIEERLRHIQARLARQIELARLATGLPVHEGASDGGARDENLAHAARAAYSLLSELPRLRLALVDDAAAAFGGDPSAKSIAEVILCYPGHFAITVHRLAHVLWNLNVPLLPRMMSEHAHRVTGIDLHPGAHIGSHFFIDHGTGVVIGETAIIGAKVRIYQGVTLGALSMPADEVERYREGVKRHPTLEDNVIVYAGATILGGTTIIGRGSVIEGNAWVVDSVPAGSSVTAQIEVHVRRNQMNQEVTQPRSPWHT